MDAPREGRFNCSREWRCPRTPLLFVVAVNALVTCTMQACSQGLLRGYQRPSYLEGIPLLQYANGTMIFMEGSVDEAKNLSTLKDLIADFSGLQIDHTKSAFLCGKPRWWHLRRGGGVPLVMSQYVFSTIPLFHLSVFKVQARVRKRL